MNVAKIPLRLAAVACALVSAIGVASAGDDASPWDGDARSAARLVAGGREHSGAFRAGVEIKLKTGWHTYWRYPGDAGVPPRFDFKGSRNVASVSILWPAPERMTEGAGVSIGYSQNVIFPLRVVPQDRSKPVALQLKLDYAICEKLCVPATAAIDLSLSAGAGAKNVALTEMEQRVPKKATLGHGKGLVIHSVHREPGPTRPRVIVDLSAPSDGPVDLFAEGPTEQWALPVPVPIEGAPPGQRRFMFELDGLPPGASDQHVALTLTAVTPEEAIEVAIRLD